MNTEDSSPEFEPTLDEVMELLSGGLEEPRRSTVSAYLQQDPEMLRAALDCLDPEELERASGLKPEAADTAWETFADERLETATESLSADTEVESVVRLREQPAATVPTVEERANLPAPEVLSIKDQREPPPAALRQRERIVHLLAAASFGALVMALFLFPRQDPSLGSVVFEEIRPHEEQGTSRGIETEPSTIDLTPGTEQLALVLVPPSSLTAVTPRIVAYTVETDGIILQENTLTLQDEGTFVLLLAAKKLNPGIVHIRLSDPKQDRLVAHYKLRIDRRISSDDG